MKKKISILTLIAVAFIIVILSGCDKKSIEAIETSTTSTEKSTTIIANNDTFQEETIASTTQKTNNTNTTKAANTRRTTGEGKKLTFNKGENVLGAWIEINGKGFSGLIKNAPMAGTVTSGVINPWEKEMIGMKIISNDEIMSQTTTPTTQATTTSPSTTAPQTTTTPPTTSQAKTRTPTGVGQSKTFQPGDTVVGWSVTINGKYFEGGIVIYNSPYGGILTDGVINPWASEITNQRVISHNQI